MNQPAPLDALDITARRQRARVDFDCEPDTWSAYLVGALETILTSSPQTPICDAFDRAAFAADECAKAAATARRK